MGTTTFQLKLQSSQVVLKRDRKVISSTFFFLWIIQFWASFLPCSFPTEYNSGSRRGWFV